MAFTVVLGLRIAQFIFALITMGLAGYGGWSRLCSNSPVIEQRSLTISSTTVFHWYDVDTYSDPPKQINYLIATPVFTFLSLAYLEITPRYLKKSIVSTHDGTVTRKLTCQQSPSHTFTSLWKSSMPSCTLPASSLSQSSSASSLSARARSAPLLALLPSLLPSTSFSGVQQLVSWPWRSSRVDSLVWRRTKLHRKPWPNRNKLPPTRPRWRLKLQPKLYKHIRPSLTSGGMPPFLSTHKLWRRSIRYPTVLTTSLILPYFRQNFDTTPICSVLQRTIFQNCSNY